MNNLNNKLSAQKILHILHSHTDTKCQLSEAWPNRCGHMYTVTCRAITAAFPILTLLSAANVWPVRSQPYCSHGALKLQTPKAVQVLSERFQHRTSGPLLLQTVRRLDLPACILRLNLRPYPATKLTLPHFWVHRYAPPSLCAYSKL